MTSNYCIEKGYWQYDFPKYLTFGITEDLNFDAQHTKILLLGLINHPKTHKLFIEPYLKKSLGFNKAKKVRFHGCLAVRHDDHIHLKIK